MWSLPEYLRRKRARVEALRERLRSPDAAPTPLRASVRVAAGSGVRPVQMRGFSALTDAGAALGGYELGPTAPELLLGALASCLAHSYLVVAADHGVAFEELEVEVRGLLDYRGTLGVDPAAPVAPTGLTYEVRYRSAADPAQIEAVRQEVERLCPVLLALTQPIAVQGQVRALANEEGV